MPTDHEKRRRREAAELLAHAQMTPRKKPGLGKNRFTLRAIFIATILCAVVFAWVSYHVRESAAQRKVAAELSEKGCTIQWGVSHLPDWFVQIAPDTIPKWMERAEGLSTQNGFDDAGHVLLGRLSDLQTLSVSYQSADPATLAGLPLARLRRLEELSIIQQEGLAPTFSHALPASPRPRLAVDLTPLRDLPRLQRIRISGFTLDEAHVAAIVDAPQLTVLCVYASSLPEEWLHRLPVLPNLNSLGIFESSDLTIASVQALAKHPRLGQLVYDGPEIPAATLEEMRRLLPNCQLESVYGQ